MESGDESPHSKWSFSMAVVSNAAQGFGGGRERDAPVTAGGRSCEKIEIAGFDIMHFQ
jgi:hypothetical protein